MILSVSGMCGGGEEGEKGENRVRKWLGRKVGKNDEGVYVIANQLEPILSLDWR